MQQQRCTQQQNLDERILAFLQEQGRTPAREVARAMGCKTHVELAAASARLARRGRLVRSAEVNGKRTTVFWSLPSQAAAHSLHHISQLMNPNFYPRLPFKKKVKLAERPGRHELEEKVAELQAEVGRLKAEAGRRPWWRRMFGK